ncbi:uncharacterized protein [Rutidosis leptorrhynchoides]|uniref:uncharacterized protein n=1 Tax=Rutidosis leptorrhynchoides TaxID=125765 RepID=UPI003A9981CD
MEAVNEYTPLNLISDEKSDWSIRVKVHITWRKTYWKNPNSASSFEMILVDEQGFKMRATLDKNSMAFFGNTFKEGDFFELSNFRVGKYDDDVPLIEHGFKIHILRATRVRKTAAFKIHRDVFNVVSYDDVNQSVLKPDDIFGKIINSYIYTIKLGLSAVFKINYNTKFFIFL